MKFFGIILGLSGLLLGGLLLGGLLLGGCAHKGNSSASSDQLIAELKVIQTNGRLKANLSVRNATRKSVSIMSLQAERFVIETPDGKFIPIKPNARTRTAAATEVAPDQSVEFFLYLTDYFSFWDRRTKYRIRYEDGAIKSNDAVIWF